MKKFATKLDLEGSLALAMSVVDRELARIATAQATTPNGLSSAELKTLDSLTKLVLAARKDSRDESLMRRVDRMSDDEIRAELIKHATAMAAS